MSRAPRTVTSPVCGTPDALILYAVRPIGRVHVTIEADGSFSQSSSIYRCCECGAEFDRVDHIRYEFVRWDGAVE